MDSKSCFSDYHDVKHWKSASNEQCCRGYQRKGCDWKQHHTLGSYKWFLKHRGAVSEPLETFSWINLTKMDGHRSNGLLKVKGQALHGTRTFIQIAHYHSIYDEVIQPPIKKSKEKLRKSGLNVEADRAFSFAGNPQINRLIAGVDTSHCLVIVTSAKSAWKSIYRKVTLIFRRYYKVGNFYRYKTVIFSITIKALRSYRLSGLVKLSIAFSFKGIY
ncbi:uncharacterized protein RAG0_02383 [Rhynchosporium agropyri]|uniref:Uncharacterized protein n=1 Tax=Rhynchosporium agropyri TaxID=914238 RepID=A0A1E1K194_9HELO|nr:uncharacterized protein RAG0_02383 [Rhynchosporium agropyri]